jgi:deferrochelatase/peroxidase EfeB
VRKLEQNVKAFRAFRQQQIDQLGPDAGERKASEIIGRLPDGTPLAPRSASASLNDFDFANDPAGARCPFFAHIRRANPRAVQDAGAAPIHLVRRGVAYGSDADFARPEGAETGVGLMFMAYMSDLDAFRTIQGSWFAHQDFPVAQPRPPASADALIFGPLATMDQNPPARWVTPKGGGYFFVPSCSWLRELEPEIA